MTDFNTYQRLAQRLCLDSSDNLEYLALGLCGESGEVAEKIKKSIRDKTLDREEVIKELGDVLWYVAVLSGYFSYELEEVAQMNLDKLTSRATKGTINGNGDNR